MLRLGLDLCCNEGDSRYLTVSINVARLYLGKHILVEGQVVGVEAQSRHRDLTVLVGKHGLLRAITVDGVEDEVCLCGISYEDLVRDDRSTVLVWRYPLDLDEMVVDQCVWWRGSLRSFSGNYLEVVRLRAPSVRVVCSYSHFVNRTSYNIS